MSGKKKKDTIEKVVEDPKVEEVKQKSSGKSSNVNLFTEGELDYQK